MVGPKPLYPNAPFGRKPQGQVVLAGVIARDGRVHP